MDPAVALVETYLRVNGYFTVTEYPIVEATRHEGYRTATDLDVLAFRFPGAGRLVPNVGRKPPSGSAEERFAPDPELGSAGQEADMLIGEVKEGRAELNQAATDPAVLRAVLTRFGCCDPQHAPAVAKELLRAGSAITHCRHRVRLVAFGSLVDDPRSRKYSVISLGHIKQFLDNYIREHWSVLSQAQFKDPVLGFLLVQEKARRGNRTR
jgi:hypothetical protein